MWVRWWPWSLELRLSKASWLKRQKRKRERRRDQARPLVKRKSTTALRCCTDTHWHALLAGNASRGGRKEKKKWRGRGERHFQVSESVDVYSTVKMYSSINITCRDDCNVERFCTCCTATDASIYNFIFAAFLFSFSFSFYQKQFRAHYHILWTMRRFSRCEDNKLLAKLWVALRRPQVSHIDLLLAGMRSMKKI